MRQLKRLMQASQHGAGNKGCEEEAGPSTWPTISGGTQSREDTRMISVMHCGDLAILNNGKTQRHSIGRAEEES
jgi:hypothetical protein